MRKPSQNLNAIFSIEDKKTAFCNFDIIKLILRYWDSYVGVLIDTLFSRLESV